MTPSPPPNSDRGLLVLVIDVLRWPDGTPVVLKRGPRRVSRERYEVVRADPRLRPFQA